MGKRLNPRHGSMQFWPRVRAKRMYARLRRHVKSDKAVLSGFGGYKAGMTHVIATDVRKVSVTANQDVSYPVTVIECPVMRIASARFYKETPYGKNISSEFFFKADKDLGRKVKLGKPSSVEDMSTLNISDYSDLRVVVYTLPRSTGLGKKTPEIFELAIGGSIEDKFAFVKENIAKDITVSDVYKEGDLVDVHAVTKGKGFQGPVKRFGVAIRAKKSQKTKRGPGSRSGGWKADAHMMYRVAQAGQMGFHQRTVYNCMVMKISDKPEEVNPTSGFINYGLVKSTYLLLKGSVPGSKKRLITMTRARRPSKKFKLPVIKSISVDSQQGR